MTALHTPSAAARVPSDERPPIEAVPTRAAVEPFQRIRRTSHERIPIVPRVWVADALPGYPVEHPSVRRFWTPILGPGATADLLRLATAARRGRSLPRPLHLATLGRHDMVRQDGAIVRVRIQIPDVPRHLEQLLPAFLRRELRARRRHEPELSAEKSLDKRK